MKHLSKIMVGTLGTASLCGPMVGHATDYIVTVGATFSASPPWEGSAHDVTRPSATFNIRRADRPYRFAPPDGGSTFALVSNRYIDFGPLVRFRYARLGEGRLTGFPKVDDAIEPGVFTNLWPTDWLRARVEARRGVSGYSGWVGDTGLDLIHTGKKWDFSLGGRGGYGDRHYLQTYFGVTPTEAAASPDIKVPYTPGPGIRYGGAEAAFAYHWTNRFRTTVDVGYRRLVDRAADSPLIAAAGSRDQISGGVGVSYSFGLGIGRKRSN